MSKNFVQSAFVRDASIGLYRIYAQAQFWRTGPRIFVNSLPKAGTHLLMSMLEVVPGIMNSRLHILTKSVVSPAASGPQLDQASLRRQLRTVRKGQVASAHLPFIASMNALIQDEGLRVVNLVRSPRDMLVSRYFYIAGLRRHHLHNHLMTHYHDKKSRLLALIEGPKSGEDTVGGLFRPYAELFRDFAAWTTAPGVLTVHYEDLVGARGGGSDERQLAALSDVSRHLSLPVSGEQLQATWKTVQDRSTATLRKGAIGDWVNHFDADIEAAFEEKVDGVMRGISV